MGGEWLREGERGGSLKEFSSRGTIIFVLSGNSLERKGRGQKSLPAPSEKNKEEKQNQNEASWRQENPSLLFLSLPSFIGPPVVFPPFPGQGCHLGLVLKTVLRGFSQPWLYLSHSIIISWRMPSC